MKKVLLLLCGLIGYAGGMMAAVGDTFSADAKVVNGDVESTTAMKFTVLTEEGSEGTVQVADGNYRWVGGVSSIARNTEGALTIPEAVENEGISYTVTRIGSSSFEACSKLTGIIIPETVTSIGFRAFANCSGLTEIVLPENLESMEGAVFLSCTSLQHIDFPANIKENADFSAILTYCTSLESVVIPEGYTALSATFLLCSSLANVVLPSTMEKISQYTFWGSPLSSFTCYAIVPPAVERIESDESTEANPFYGSLYETAILYVPKGSKEAYEAAEYWQDFGRIVEMEDWTLTVTNAMFASFYLDRPVRIPRENADLLGVYTAREVDGNELTLDKFEADVVPAKTPVLVFANPGTYTFPFELTDETIEADEVMKGVLDDTDVADLQEEGKYDILTLGRGKTGGFIGFYSYTKTTLPAYKCYIPLESTSSVKGVQIVFPDGTETGIDAIDNGQLTMDNVVYDLSGRRVSNPGKGLYIMNGKKVLKK